ncbi:hypothetical protein Ciccas_005502 [Cichlidogyrus casuarinus]|uniref:Small ribosomal subunit protein uS2 n=1 Tax=Cichlidogyrus casuarinus TaxID=1844966 RepID=A0ABD2Q8H5_9PLAT
MSGGTSALELTTEDLNLMLSACVHLGSSNSNFQMEQYIHGRTEEGFSIFRLQMTWEKILLAARAIAAIPYSQDVFAIGTRTSTQRACLKFAHFCNATGVANRFTPGAFTNQIQPGFREPRLLIVSDPMADHQAVREASKAGIPVIGFCNSNTRLNYIDIAIPCNNQSDNAIGLMWWLLAREVRRITGKESRQTPWDVMVDMFIYRKPSEIAADAEEVDQGFNAQDNMNIDDSEWQHDSGMPGPGMPAVGTMMDNYAEKSVKGDWSNYDSTANW